MKRGFKDIEHAKYSAPTKTRKKVDGRWVYETLERRARKFCQRVRIRFAAMSIAKRYAPHLFEAFKTYVDHDRLVTQLIVQGEKNPSTMAKKKFYVHRPKPADNRAKNAMRRFARRSWQVIKGRSKGNKPTPALVTNAAQVRINQANVSVKYYRAICRDQATGRRNYGFSSQSGIGARECARRRWQMGLA